jgi:lipid-A-disaccharide synthase
LRVTSRGLGDVYKRQDAACVAILPGSRHGEVTRLSEDFAQTIAWLIEQQPSMCFVAPMANVEVKRIFTAALEDAGILSKVLVLDGQSQSAMIASDVVLLASGTATLEATLIKRPMVVAYRLSQLTTWLLKGLGMVKTAYFSQPNLLANKSLVPEYFNEQVRADVLGPSILKQLQREDRVLLDAEYVSIHEQLRQNASEQAARAVVELLQSWASSKQ